MSTPFSRPPDGKYLSALRNSGWDQGRSSKTEYDDPLAYLLQKRVEEYQRQQIIYSPGSPCNRLYLVTWGRVAICGFTGEGKQAVTRVVGKKGLFGECALVLPGERQELTIALDKTGLMSWTRDEVESQIERDPRLGLALAKYLACECMKLNIRLENHIIHNTPERVVLTLIELAESLGMAREDGAMRMPHLTHQTIAEYVGTSREIVTFHMTRLRRMKLLRYDRTCVDVYTGRIVEMLRSQGITVPSVSGQHYE